MDNWTEHDLEKLEEEFQEGIEAAVGKPPCDPDEFDEAREDKIREQMGKLSHYAEDGPEFDPEGNYLCGSCLYRIVMDWAVLDRCYIVSGPTKMDIGGCAIYRIGTPDSESNPLPILKTYSQAEAFYEERPQSKGFGCSRCSYAFKAKKADSKDRPLWCGFWGAHVRPRACCDRQENK